MLLFRFVNAHRPHAHANAHANKHANEHAHAHAHALATFSPQKIVQDAKLLRKEVVVAAPTGVAAVNLGPELGAQTIHSLAGVGVPHTASNFEKMLAPYIVKKWKKIEVLVLDEVGMLSADFLDWMDVYVRKARRKPLKAFGGIQLIFVGDFAQLGPIPGKAHSIHRKTYEPDEPGADCLLGVSECTAYAFQTVLWR